MTEPVHKTPSPWLNEKMESQVPVALPDEVYYQLIGCMVQQGRKTNFRERRSDNRALLVIGNVVFQPASQA